MFNSKRIYRDMKKSIYIPLVIATLGCGIILTMSLQTETGAEFDLPGLNQQVQRQGEQIDNHEARITNNENDISDLQDNTSTPPRSSRVDVPSVTTPPAEPLPASSETEPTPQPEPEPEPEPIVVVSYEQVPMNTGYNNEDMDCKLTYSDGTTYQWHWKVVSFNQTKITNTYGTCDPSVIGRNK